MFSNWLFCGGYFPIQNLPKIFPNRSSVEIVPVISPRKMFACLISMATKSPGIWFSIPSKTLLRLSLALFNKSKCLSLVTIIPDVSIFFFITESNILSFSSWILSLFLAEILIWFEGVDIWSPVNRSILLATNRVGVSLI